MGSLSTLIFDMPNVLTFRVVVMMMIVELLPEGVRQAQKEDYRSFALSAACGVAVMTLTKAMLPC